MIKWIGKCRERENIKFIVPFRSYPTRNSKFQKIAKKFKKLNNTILWLHYKPKLVGKRREIEKI